YLLQLGAIVSIAGPTAERYLSAGKPVSHRVALLLRGEATVVRPRGSAGNVRYEATLRPGDLVGHEALVMDVEAADSSRQQVRIVDPVRTTEVRLAPGTQALQFYWYALRWVLDYRAAVWDRVKRMLRGEPTGSTAPIPTIVSFHAARQGLGTTLLACGTAAGLARSGGHVELIDLQGPDNFAERWKPCGFSTTDRPVPLHAGPTVLRAKGRPTEVHCRVLVPPPGLDWPAKLEILWPADPDPTQAEDLVDALEMDASVSHIVVAGADREAHGLMSQVL